MFGLSTAVLEASSATTLDDFGNAILIGDGQRDDQGPAERKPAPVPDIVSSNLTSRLRGGSPTQPGPELRTLPVFRPTRDVAPRSPLVALRNDGSITDEGSGVGVDRPSTASTVAGLTDHRRIADVVIAKNLDRASAHVQIQALELLRSKRIFTRTEVHSAPARFLFVAVLASDQPGPRLVSHLNDHLFLSHYHSQDDGFPNLEEEEEEEEEEQDAVAAGGVSITNTDTPSDSVSDSETGGSASSVVRRSPRRARAAALPGATSSVPPLFTAEARPHPSPSLCHRFSDIASPSPSWRPPAARCARAWRAGRTWATWRCSCGCSGRWRAE